HLYPVNYSVTSNDDIFELIKFDVLFELLKNDKLEYEHADFSKLFSAQFFVLEKSEELLKFFSKTSDKLGKGIITIIEPLIEIKDKFDSYCKKHSINDYLTAVKHLKSVTQKTGNIYEEDVITQIISYLIEQIKESGKKPVLIIDDLDRIDPEHIFRILNV